MVRMDEAAPRRVVLADWDNTLSAGFTQVRWVEYLDSRNLFRAATAVRGLTADYLSGSLEYEDFCDEMGKAYAAGLAGRSPSEIVAAARQFVKHDRPMFPFVRELWRLFEAEALAVTVISGAPAEILDQYAGTIGFDVGGALQPEIKNQRYTGHLLENVGLREYKLAAVQRMISNSSVVIALGDAVSDLPLLEVASVACVVVGSQTRCSPFVPGIVPIDPADKPAKLADQLRQALAQRRQTANAR
jgi:phosphoserine phosphatase